MVMCMSWFAMSFGVYGISCSSHHTNHLQESSRKKSNGDFFEETVFLISRLRNFDSLSNCGPSPLVTDIKF